MVSVRARGFTLVELIIVIVISGIIAVGSTRFITNTATGYAGVVSRQAMASLGVIATEKITKELRSALPNSVRVNGANTCIEFVPVLAANRYTVAPVSPTSADTAISVVANSYSLNGSVSEYAAIYPSDVGSVYSPGTSTSLTNTQIASLSSSAMTLGAAHQFPADSPTRRVYVVSDPVAYCYATVSGQNGLFRYSGYGFNSTMVAPPTGGTRELLINQVTPGTVDFEVVPATYTRNALAKIAFEVTAAINLGGGAETLTINHEVQIRNVP